MCRQNDLNSRGTVNMFLCSQLNRAHSLLLVKYLGPIFEQLVQTRFIDKPGLNYAKTVVFLKDGFLKSSLKVNLVQIVVNI